MNDATSHGLFDAFPPAGRAAWEEAARASLRGGSLESLAGLDADGLARAPIYDAEDLRELRHLALVDPPGPALAATNLPAAWEIRQRPQALTLETLRVELAESVARGQRVLPVALGKVIHDAASLRALLKDLDLRNATLELETTEPRRAAFLLQEVGGGHSLLAEWSDPRPAARELAELWAGEGPLAARATWRASGVAAHEAGATPVQELAQWLAAWATGLRELEAAGAELDQALTATRHELAASHEIFETIAKLRAARLLAARLLEACGRPVERRTIRLEVRGDLGSRTEEAPWTQLLRATLQGFAAGAGGVDVLHLPAMTERPGGADARARRLAANTQVILQEEAQLARVADPGRGSWYLESLSARLAGAAWARFRESESVCALRRAGSAS